MIWIWWLACGNPEVLLDCEEPEAGDLEGYCLMGRDRGTTTARSDRSACVEEPTNVPYVAHGPGGCDEPSEAVLAAEQEAFASCWQEAYDEELDLLVPETGDTGCVPVTTGGL